MSNFRWNPKVADDALRAAGKGLEAATIFLTGAIKETLSVPAPRISVTDAKGGRRYVAGFKLNDPKRMVTPYIGGAKEATIRSFRFVKAGQLGPPKPITMRYQTAPAIKGDPPRKLSGRLRTSITYEMLDKMQLFEGGTQATKGRVGTNVKYARRLEFGPGDHGFMMRTYRYYRRAIQNIVNESI